MRKNDDKRYDLPPGNRRTAIIATAPERTHPLFDYVIPPILQLNYVAVRGLVTHRGCVLLLEQ